MGPIIEINHLCCKAGYRYLLHDINWKVNPGENWVLFGMNGCGKTTLLSIISGFRAYSSGEVKLFGETFQENNALDIRRRIGFVSNSFFDKNLSSESVLNIVLAGKFGTLGIDGDVSNKDIKQAKALLTELRIGDKVNRSFSSLSKGERQSVMIARAFMSNPDILILDEPGTGLDVIAREYMLSTVKDLANNTSIAIIYVTHYTEEILDVFEHCVLMGEGKFKMQGKTEEIFNETNISNLLKYPVHLDHHNGRYQVDLDIQSHIGQLIK